MISCTGIGINDFIAIGRAKIIVNKSEEDFPVNSEHPELEMKRLNGALKTAKAQLQKLHDKTEETVGANEALIFEMHQMMLEDADFTDMLTDGVSQGFTAEHAVIVARDSFSEMLIALNDDYMSKRADDVKDIAARLIDCLNDVNVDSDDDDDDIPLIICAEDLLPSQVVSMDLDHVKAIALSKGSTNSHASILANSFGLASVVNLGDVFSHALNKNDCVVIVDGAAGTVVIDPDKSTLMEAKKRYEEQQKHLEKLKQLKGKPAETKDGKRVELAANIGGPEDIPLVLKNDAESVGLFRSEFVYLGCDDYPSEEELFETYKNVLSKMEGKRVVIRTLDIGSDKSVPYFKLDDEENPALGLRAIRLCYSRAGLLETQLRALYRASVYGKLAIMFPMVVNVWEVERLKELCDEVKNQLDAENIKYDDSVEIGIMIETPAAAIISDKLAPMVDFFSVGTNDLTQYTLACDRQNPNLLPFCDTHHEAIMMLIERAAWFAHENNCWIGICGELAADTSLTERFLKMGIDEFSMSPVHILKIREVVRDLDLSINNELSTKQILKETLR